jgi:glucosylceramidase
MDRLEYFARSKWWAKPCGQFCFAPLHADTVTDELIYTPLIIILVISQNLFDQMLKESVAYPAAVLTTSFVNEDGKVITVVMNQSDKEAAYNLCVGSKSARLSFLRMLYKP